MEEPHSKAIAQRCLRVGELAWLNDLQQKHAAKDRELLLDWCSGRLNREQQAAIGTYLSSDISALAAVPGCAGLHLPSSHPLRDFMLWIFTIELAAIAGCSLSLDIVDRDTLVFPLSGLRVQNLDGRHSGVCCASADGTIQIQWGTAPAAYLQWDAELRAFRSNTATELLVGHPEAIRGIRLDSYAVYDFGLAGSQARTRKPSTLANKERQTINMALRLLEVASPETLSEIRGTRTNITALITRPDLVRQSYSVEAVPRVIYCATRTAFDLADVVCHEYHHLKLFLIEEEHQLLRNPTVAAVAPWRRDMRTARGVLHGLYVFYTLATIFGHLFDIFPPSNIGLRKLLMWRTAVDVGVTCLRKADWQPTPLGADLLDAIEGGNREQLDRITSQNATTANRVRALVSEHVARVSGSDEADPFYVAF
jgi:HEXXH motif-containing protein